MARLLAVADSNRSVLQKQLVGVESQLKTKTEELAKAASQTHALHIELQQSEQRLHVASLRLERLRSAHRLTNVQLESTQRQVRQQHECRESEVSELQISAKVNANQIDALRRAIATKDQQIQIAWQDSQEAAKLSDSHQLALQRARAHEERLIQMQAAEFEMMQNQIRVLVAEQQNAIEQKAVISHQTENAIAERDEFIDLMTRSHDQLELQVSETAVQNRTLEDQILQSSQSATQLHFDLHQAKLALKDIEDERGRQIQEAAKLRAQLSGGRARGAFVIQQYKERLEKAKQTIATLRIQRNELIVAIQGKNASEDGLPGQEVKRWPKEVNLGESDPQGLKNSPDRRAA